MATTATEAWDALSAHEQSIADDSGRDGFFLGFTAGWKAQENRPYHCMYCGFEAQGKTDGETIALAQDHVKACESHPLAIENTRLTMQLKIAGDALNGIVYQEDMSSGEGDYPSPGTVAHDALIQMSVVE